MVEKGGVALERANGSEGGRGKSGMLDGYDSAGELVGLCGCVG